MSFAVQPGGSVPSTRTSMFFAGFCSKVCVASTCSTSEVPIPNASAPMRAMRAGMGIAANDRHARQGNPLLRPDRHARCPAAHPSPEIYGTPKSATFFSSVSICSRLSGSAMPPSAVLGRNVVVDHRNGRIHPPHLAPGQPQAPQTPAATSPHARDAGRYRGRTCHPPSGPPHAHPRSCRTKSVRIDIVVLLVKEGQGALPPGPPPRAEPLESIIKV